MENKPALSLPNSGTARTTEQAAQFHAATTTGQSSNSSSTGPPRRRASVRLVANKLGAAAHTLGLQPLGYHSDESVAAPRRRSFRAKRRYGVNNSMRKIRCTVLARYFDAARKALGMVPRLEDMQREYEVSRRFEERFFASMKDQHEQTRKQIAQQRLVHNQVSVELVLGVKRPEQTCGGWEQDYGGSGKVIY